jgi:predicted DsbA family dithiol-disulfide isomerase
VLVRLAGDAGLDVDEAQGVLAGDAFAEDVRTDVRRARQLGISGVPFFVLAERYGVSGAQASEVLLAALEQAWAEHAPASAATGDVCGPDGCDTPVS